MFATSAYEGMKLKSVTLTSTALLIKKISIQAAEIPGIANAARITWLIDIGQRLTVTICLDSWWLRLY